MQNLLEEIPYERNFTLKEAKARFDLFLHSQQLTCTVRSAGESLFATECILFDNNEQAIASGYGKGTSKFGCEIGAMFEAAEHYLTRTVAETWNKFNHLSPDELRTAKGDIDTIPLEIIIRQKSGKVPCRKYSCLKQTATAYYPAALIDPSWFDEDRTNLDDLCSRGFDYNGADRYANNSGVAIGCSKSEAIVHGLMESIERQAFSKFLIDAFLLLKRDSIRLVEKSSLPPSVLNILETAQLELGMSIELVSLKSPGNIPVYCAIPHSSSHAIEAIGLGASLRKSHAAQRALTELVQAHYIATEFRPTDLGDRDQNVLNRFKSKPLHLRCARMKLFECFPVNSLTRHLFGKESDNADINQTQKIIHLTSEILKKDENITVYTTPIIIENCGIEVWHTMLNSHDNFFCVTEGSYVLPDVRLSGNYR